ncbi:reverse transcriptase domain-containing protein [Enterobacter ludwigii]
MARSLQTEQWQYVCRTDIQGFYSHIRRGPLMRQLNLHVSDPVLLNLVRQYLHYSVERGGEFYTPQKGICRGCALSPLLAGFCLWAMDTYFEAQQPHLRYVRFMDDIVILTRTRWHLRRAVRTLNVFFASGGYRQHPDKTFIGKTEKGFDWMGIQFNRSGIEGVAPRAMASHRQRLRRLYEQAWRYGKVKTRARVGEYVRRWKIWGKFMLEHLFTAHDYPPRDRRGEVAACRMRVACHSLRVLAYDTGSTPGVSRGSWPETGTGSAERGGDRALRTYGYNRGLGPATGGTPGFPARACPCDPGGTRGSMNTIGTAAVGPDGRRGRTGTPGSGHDDTPRSQRAGIDQNPGHTEPRSSRLGGPAIRLAVFVLFAWLSPLSTAFGADACQGALFVNSGGTGKIVWTLPPGGPGTYPPGTPAGIYAGSGFSTEVTCQMRNNMNRVQWAYGGGGSRWNNVRRMGTGIYQYVLEGVPANQYMTSQVLNAEARYELTQATLTCDGADGTVTAAFPGDSFPASTPAGGAVDVLSVPCRNRAATGDVTIRINVSPQRLLVARRGIVSGYRGGSNIGADNGRVLDTSFVFGGMVGLGQSGVGPNITVSPPWSWRTLSTNAYYSTGTAGTSCTTGIAAGDVTSAGTNRLNLNWGTVNSPPAASPGTDLGAERKFTVITTCDDSGPAGGRVSQGTVSGYTTFHALPGSGRPALGSDNPSVAFAFREATPPYVDVGLNSAVPIRFQYGVPTPGVSSSRWVLLVRPVVSPDQHGSHLVPGRATATATIDTWFY